MDLQKPVIITEKAMTELQNTLSSITFASEFPTPLGLRIAAKGGACGGEMSFSLGFDTKNEDDATFDYGTFKVYIEKKYVMHIFGLEIDFEERQNEQGFVFNTLD